MKQPGITILLLVVILVMKLFFNDKHSADEEHEMVKSILIEGECRHVSSGKHYLYFNISEFHQYNDVHVQVDIKKLDQTISGKFSLQKSIDGVNYDEISESQLINSSSQWEIFSDKIEKDKHGKIISPYYRIEIVSEGEQEVTFVYMLKY